MRWTGVWKINRSQGERDDRRRSYGKRIESRGNWAGITGVVFVCEAVSAAICGGDVGESGEHEFWGAFPIFDCATLGGGGAGSAPGDVAGVGADFEHGGVDFGGDAGDSGGADIFFVALV